MGREGVQSSGQPDWSFKVWVFLSEAKVSAYRFSGLRRIAPSSRDELFRPLSHPISHSVGESTGKRMEKKKTDSARRNFSSLKALTTIAVIFANWQNPRLEDRGLF